MTNQKDINEVLEQLKKTGVSAGQWQEQPEKLVTSNVLTGQADNLKKLRDILGQLVEADRKRIRVLREQVIRLEHGGGS